MAAVRASSGCHTSSSMSKAVSWIRTVQHSLGAGALKLPVQAANSLALGTSPVVRALFDPEGGMRSVRALDNVSFSDWFTSHGGSRQSIKRMWDPIGGSLALLSCLHPWGRGTGHWEHVGSHMWDPCPCRLQSTPV